MTGRVHRRGGCAWGALSVLVACGRVGFTPPDVGAEPDASSPEDAEAPADASSPEDAQTPPDAGPSCLDRWDAPAFGVPVPLDALNSTCATQPRCADQESFLDADGLTLYFQSDRGASPDIYHATRPAVGAPFGPPELVSELNTDTTETDFAHTADVWAVSSDRDSPCTDIFLSGPPPLAFVRDAALSSDQDDFNLWISPDGLSIAFGSRRGTETTMRPCGATERIYAAERRTRDEPFSAPRLLDLDADASALANPTFLDQGRLAVFNSVVGGVNRLRLARRVDGVGPFGPPVEVPIAGDPSPNHPFVTADGCELFLNLYDDVSGMDLHRAELVP